MRSLLFVLIALLNLSFIHDYHVAISNVKYNENSKTLEITQKIFLDDLEKSILNEWQVKLSLGTSKQNTESKKIIGEYITKHLIFRSENKAINLNYIGFEQENELIFAYFETSKLNKSKPLSISNDLLFASFSDQANIMHFKVNNQQQSLYFNKNNKEEIIRFKPSEKND